MYEEQMIFCGTQNIELKEYYVYVCNKYYTCIYAFTDNTYMYIYIYIYIYIK